MIINKTKRDRYLDQLCSRYSSIAAILTGRQATGSDSHHGLKGHSHWLTEILEKSAIVDNLDLNLAIDDLSAILKEIKKLAK